MVGNNSAVRNTATTCNNKEITSQNFERNTGNLHVLSLIDNLREVKEVLGDLVTAANNRILIDMMNTSQ